jgi:hypothetical protein
MREWHACHDQCWEVLKIKDRHSSVINSSIYSLTHPFSKFNEWVLVYNHNSQKYMKSKSQPDNHWLFAGSFHENCWFFKVLKIIKTIWSFLKLLTSPFLNTFYTFVTCLGNNPKKKCMSDKRGDKILFLLFFWQYTHIFSYQLKLAWNIKLFPNMVSLWWKIRRWYLIWMEQYHQPPKAKYDRSFSNWWLREEGYGLLLLFLFLVCFLACYECDRFFIVDGDHYGCGSSLGKLSMVCCFYAMILLDINQGGS